MRNNRFPNYPDDTDYNTNAPSYYDDMARKQKLIELLSKRIWEYDEKLNDRLDELNSVLSDYLDQWDDRIENLDDEVSHIFVTWLNDGTLEQIINHDVLGNKADKEYVDELNETITSQLTQSIRYVNYEMFREDGLSDDEIIMQTHVYANEHNIPVINVEGTYNLDNPITIPIETSVDWGATSFIINEQNYLKREYMIDENHFFHIKHKNNPVVLDSFNRETIRLAYNHKETEIPILEKFNNCYMIIESDFHVDMVGNRFPSSTPSWTKRDFFRIASEGKLIGDFMWDEFTSITKATIQEIEEPLTITGGHFILNSQSPLNLEDGDYVNSQIKVTRSNVTLKNQTIMLQKDTKDNMLNPQWGFILVKDCTNVKLENVYGTPRYANDGTYVFRAENVFELHFDNVTMYGKDDSWSSTGTNYVKNWKIENSKVDVVDVHFMGWNIIASDSTINRFALTGGGLLKLRNIKSRVATALVDFRKDYGSSWNGVIDIKHVTMEVYNHVSTKPNIVSWTFATEYEFKTPLIIAKEISIENVHIEYTDTATPTNMPILSFGTAWNSEGYPNKIHFPKQISIKNITAGGHAEGVHVFNMEGTQNYILEDDGGMIQGEYVPNCIIIIDNVQLPNYRIPTIPDDVLAHFYNNIAQSQVINLTKKSFYPHYQIKNCKNIVVYENGNRKSLYTFENSHINRINAWGSIGVFKDCRVQGNIGSIYTVNGMGEYHFYNTIFFPPIINGEVVNTIEALNTHYAFNYNNVSRIYGNYVNSRIAKGFINENPIDDAFESLLFSSKN